MKKPKTYAMQNRVPETLRPALEAGAKSQGISANQFLVTLATEALEGRTHRDANLEALAGKVQKMEKTLEREIVDVDVRLMKVQAAVDAYSKKLDALEQSVTALAEGVERLAERVVILKNVATGGAVQVIDTPASVNGGTGGAIR